MFRVEDLENTFLGATFYWETFMTNSGEILGLMSHVSIACFLTERPHGFVGIALTFVLFFLIMTGKVTKYLFLAKYPH